jgi:DNA-binding Lrp family transcriptional regulator
MVGAYVLIKAYGSIETLLKGLKKIKGVKGVSPVTGPYDLIVEVESEDVNSLAKVVVSRIRKVKGISDTLTCIKVEL